MPDAAVPVAHTLTVAFGRLLTEADWRVVMEKARKIPYARQFRVDTVTTLPVDTVKGT